MSMEDHPDVSAMQRTHALLAHPDPSENWESMDPLDYPARMVTTVWMQRNSSRLAPRDASNALRAPLDRPDHPASQE